MRRILPAVLVTVLGAATMSVGCSDATNLGPLAQLDEVKRLRAAGEHAEGGAAPAAVASSGTGWGTLQGNFVFEGDSPAAKILPTGGKDAPTCNPGGIPDESLVINAQNKGIKNIVIYARKVSRVNEEYAATESQPVELDQKNCMFLTHVSAVRVSQPIVLKNSEGSVGHNTSISPPADKGTNPVVPPTGTAEYKFSRQQNVPVPVTCSIHPWMKSYVIPRDNPYFAVTDANGAFTIKSLPAGEKLEFQVWHESSSGAQGALEVPGLTDGKGRFVKTLAEGEDLKLGELKVPTADFKLQVARGGQPCRPAPFDHWTLSTGHSAGRPGRSMSRLIKMTRKTLFAPWPTGREWLLVSLACVALVTTVGCNRVEPPRYRLNLEGFDLAGEKTAEERETEQANEQKIVNLLTAAFGTPDEPYVFPETGLDLKKLQLAAGASYSDQKGYQRGLYRKNCAHCHGVTGDGAGPTALFLNPYPRDYRQGKFKFTSTNADTVKPTTADLKHTVNEGFVGTAMPSFKLLPGYEVDALVEYVKYLSIRGETELLLRYLIANEEALPNDRATLLEQIIQPVEAWKAAEDAVLVPNQENLPPLDAAADPAAYAASIERGRLLFRDGKTANCIKCHGLNGLGDGGGDALYDDWNKEKPVHPDYAWQLPVQQLHPRNLRLGLYRGGRRPADIYRRISAGIKGTPMPAAGKVLTQPGQIWDLVNYILSLPYEDEAHASHAEDHATASRGQL